MERKWQLIIFFIAMIILSAGGYGYIISESTAPPEMETYDFGEFTMEIPEDSNVKLAGSDLSLSVYVGDNFQVIKINKTAHIPTFAAGYWLFGFASKKYHPIDDLDADAWKALNLRTRYYTTRLHVGAFYLPAFLEEMLREVEEPK